MSGDLNFSDILSRVTENPQAMAMLSSLLGGSMPFSPKEAEAPPPKKEETVETVSVLAKPHIPHKDEKAEQRRRLLVALKPFLSKERGQALETLLVVLDAISLLPRGKEPPCT